MRPPGRVLILACVGAASAAVGCAEPARAPAPVPAAPVALPCTLHADVGLVHGYRMALRDTLRHHAERGGDALAELFAERPGEMGDVLGLATRRDPVRADTIVTCPDAAFLLGDGLVTDVVVGLATAVESDGDERDPGADALRSVVLRGAYADWSHGWRIHVTPPRDVFAGMRPWWTRAEVWLSIARRWATIDVTMVATVEGDRLVLASPPLEAAVQDAGAPLHQGFRLVEASVDGRAADVALGTGGYLVIGSLTPGVVQVRLRYEGALPLVGDNRVEARLLDLARWLPSVPYAPPARVVVDVHHPRGDEVVASLPVVGEALGADGWRTTRLAGVTDRDPALVLVDAAPRGRVWEDDGARIELAATPAVSLEACAPVLERITRALAPLGPVGRVRVVGLPAVYGRHGRRADDTVVVLRSVLVDACQPGGADGAGAEARRRHVEAVALLAHELAHGWFGRRVRAADDEAAAWWEAVSEYVSTWALDDVAAAEVRRGWLDDYAEVAHRDLFALAQRIPTSGKLRDALSYAKGALLFAALEAKLGRERVAAVLRQFVAATDGRIASWLDLVTATQVVAGSDAARWLHRWVTAIGAPELGVRDVAVERDGGGARVRFAVVQDGLEAGAAPFEATVDVALQAGDRVVSAARIPLSAIRTDVVLELPRGVTRIVVDPWSRLPRFGIAEADVPGALAGR